MDSAVDNRQTDPHVNPVLAGRADERLAHAYEQIARADEELARFNEQFPGWSRSP